MNAARHHRERDAAPVPTDIADKLIAFKRKQARYVRRRAYSPPPAFNPSHILFYFTAILDRRTVQNVLPPNPNLHRPAGNPLQGRHLRSSYLGLSQTLASSPAF